MFLHPFMLAGFAATGIPIAVHLLNRRRTVDVTWAAMRFLTWADDRHRRRLRVEDLLLLALRCGLLAVLAAAAAGPVFGHGAGLGRGAVTAVVVIDASASMTGTDGVASRFDRAKAAAARAMADLPTGSAIAVLMASDTVTPLIPVPTHDLSLARQLIADAAFSDRSTDLLPAIRAAADVLRGTAGPKVLDLFTDGQRGGWGRVTDVATVLRSVPEVAAHLVLVGPDVHQNVGLSDLRSAGDLTPVGRPVRFEATVTNYGTDDLHAVPVRLAVDDGPPAAEATVDDFPPGESRTVSLYAKFPTPGPHAVTASVRADRLPADDRRTVIVRADDHMRVLILDGDAGDHSDRTAAAYLRAALLPVPADRVADYFVQVTVVPAAAAATTPLDGYAAVFAAGGPAFGPAAADALAAYVRGGGGLVYFPRPDTPADGTNADLFGRLHLLPAAIGPSHGDADHPLTLSAGPFDHPIAALWKDPANGSPAAAHIDRAAVLVADPATTVDAGPPRAILSFADGTPFALERSFGRGRCVLFATSADTAGSDLPDHAGLFVPLVYRCLAAAAGRGDEGLNVRVGQPLVGPAAVGDVGRPVLVRRPDGTADDTTITLTAATAGYRYAATDRAGTYAATVGRATTLFAAAVDPAESRLEPLTADQRATLSSVATVAPDLEPTPAYGSTTGNDVGSALLLVALAAAAAEPFVADRFSRSR